VTARASRALLRRRRCLARRAAGRASAGSSRAPGR
jgi:hypothetical protein